MGLIIKDKLPMLKKGYPTVSDKYNVAGAILAGEDAVEFGDVVGFADTKGYFKKLTSAEAATDVAGIVVATNVKLNMEYGGDAVKTYPGEAFNLLVSGFIAIAVDSGDTEQDIKANGQVYVTPTGTLSAKEASNFALDGVVFTGTVEKHGETILAEIYIK